MKKGIFAILMLLCIVSVNAQENNDRDVSESKTVQLLQKEGTLLKKEFYDIGTIKGSVNNISFQNIILTDLSTGQKYGALRITTYYFSSSYVSDSYIGTLDYEELAGCIKSLQYMKENILSTLPGTYTECEYKTKDGVSLGAFIKTRNSQQEWMLYIRTRQYTDRSWESIKLEQLDSLISLFNSSLENLQSHL